MLRQDQRPSPLRTAPHSNPATREGIGADLCSLLLPGLPWFWNPRRGSPGLKFGASGASTLVWGCRRTQLDVSGFHRPSVLLKFTKNYLRRSDNSLIILYEINIFLTKVWSIWPVF